jgi:hypothetical protein
MILAQAPPACVADRLVAFPHVETLWIRILVVVAAYVVTLILSGPIVRFFVLPKGGAPPDARPAGRFDSSVVVGKCENILTLTFVIMNQVTGLALVFAAKSLVRKDDIERNPGFYLGGTLVNLVWGLLVGVATRLVLFGK